MSLGFYFDMTHCIGCKTCQIACKDVNDLPTGTLFRHVQSYETGTFPSVHTANYSLTCNHCEDPACVAICPVGAMQKAEDGTVVHDDETCIGCQACVAACPYGVPSYREDLGIVQKCNACKQLRDGGERPACVSACIMRCLDFGDMDELRERYGDEFVDEVPGMADPSQTHPNTRVRVKDAAFELGDSLDEATAYHA